MTAQIIKYAINIRETLINYAQFFNLVDTLVLNNTTNDSFTLIPAIIKAQNPTPQQLKELPNLETNPKQWLIKGISTSYTKEQLVHSGLRYIIQGNFIGGEYITGTGTTCSYVSIEKGPPHLSWDLLVKEDVSSSYRLDSYSL